MLDYGSRGCWFESSRGHFLILKPLIFRGFLIFVFDYCSVFYFKPSISSLKAISNLDRLLTKNALNLSQSSFLKIFTSSSW